MTPCAQIEVGERNLIAGARLAASVFEKFQLVPPKATRLFAGGTPQTNGKGTDMKQLSTEQRLTRLIELKAQRDEIDREIAVLLGDAPVPRRTRSSERAMSSGNSQTVSHSKAIENGSPTADPNGSSS